MDLFLLEQEARIVLLHVKEATGAVWGTKSGWLGALEFLEHKGKSNNVSSSYDCEDRQETIQPMPADFTENRMVAG